MRTIVLLLVIFSWSPGVLAQVPDPDYVMSVTDSTGAQGGTSSSQVFFDSSAGVGIQGWSFGVCHDATDLTVLDSEPGLAVLTAKNGNEADFVSILIFPNGVACGVVVCLTGCAALPPGPAYEFLVTTYDVLAATGTTTPLELCNEVGDPPVFIALVDVFNNTVIPVVEDGSVTVVPGFSRGDVNGDGVTDISDGLFLASWLFGVGPPGMCEDAGDINDNGTLEGLVDTIALLSYLFTGGAPPPAPFPGCGDDATPDALDCVQPTC